MAKIIRHGRAGLRHVNIKVAGAVL